MQMDCAADKAGIGCECAVGNGCQGIKSPCETRSGLSAVIIENRIFESQMNIEVLNVYCPSKAISGGGLVVIKYTADNPWSGRFPVIRPKGAIKIDRTSMLGDIAAEFAILDYNR